MVMAVTITLLAVSIIFLGIKYPKIVRLFKNYVLNVFYSPLGLIMSAIVFAIVLTRLVER